jgi:catechol 2,3-dioxygenase-like lactoylglutathione lyase family enzyme
VSELSDVVVFTADIEGSLGFYRVLLSWPIVERGGDYAILSNGESRLVLHHSHEAESSQVPRSDVAIKPVFTISRETFSLLARDGRSIADFGHFSDETWDYYNAIDPDGNVLGLKIPPL